MPGRFFHVRVPGTLPLDERSLCTTAVSTSVEPISLALLRINNKHEVAIPQVQLSLLHSSLDLIVFSCTARHEG